MSAMKRKIVIIGGGIAGLCAAIRLSELGETPILIEGGTYPAHKVCGEFLSPECMHLLHAWHIHPTPISQAILRTSKQCLSFTFPSIAGGMSHMQLDPALAKHAAISGAKIYTSTQVKALHPKQHAKEMHQITLSNGETLEASHVIIATGRIPSYSLQAPATAYMGFKTHFQQLPSTGELEMFSFPGAYLGIAPVENGIYNVACLAHINSVNQWSHPTAFIENLITQNPHLHASLAQGKNLFDQWMVASVPEFGIKRTPDWLDTFFIGDAAVTIPPACGNGLTMAILGGRLAAEYALVRTAEDFKAMWTKRCTSQMFWGKLLHRLMLNPTYSGPLYRLAHYLPSLSQKVFNLTRQPV